ncbi:MAG: hypothetical protein GVY27_01525 [Deinococcus-Thermus bacterium]|jgi:hypothetical protein|nr:hypothetical protein [Deinococcota bacterium]
MAGKRAPDPPQARKVVPGPDDVDGAGQTADTEAYKEASAFASGRLDEVSERKEHDRRERFRDNASIGGVVILWLLMSSTAFAIVALAVEYLTPWGWLAPNQLNAVQTSVFSGAVITAVGGYLRRYLD